MITLRRDFRLGKNVILNFCGLDDYDISAVREMRNHSLIRKWMYSRKIVGPREHLSFFSGLKDKTNDFYWLVKASGVYIGVIYLNRLDRKNRHAYLGIYANPLLPIKDKGFQLLQCLKYIGFTKAGLKTIKLEVFEDNMKAIVFYRKNGFKTEGRLRAFVLSGRDWKDVLIMGLTRS